MGQGHKCGVFNFLFLSGIYLSLFIKRTHKSQGVSVQGVIVQTP